MHLTSDAFPDHTCDVSLDQQTGVYVGQLHYKSADRGFIRGHTLEAVKAQFIAIADLASQGAMVREGTIMTGYHDKRFKGDVLLYDGEMIGTWESDDFEWCYFTKEGAAEVTVTAASPWLLQDAIADWLSSERVAAVDSPKSRR